MLKIYQGRENIDKEKFIYEHTEGETLVIVPNQYTLVAGTGFEISEHLLSAERGDSQHEPAGSAHAAGAEHG